MAHELNAGSILLVYLCTVKPLLSRCLGIRGAHNPCGLFQWNGMEYWNVLFSMLSINKEAGYCYMDFR